VIAKDNDKKIEFDRKSLGEAVQRVALLTGDRARAVRLQFGADQMVISAANPDLGEAVEEVPCDYDGPEFRLGINPDYLSQFLVAAETRRCAWSSRTRTPSASAGRSTERRALSLRDHADADLMGEGGRARPAHRRRFPHLAPLALRPASGRTSS